MTSRFVKVPEGADAICTGRNGTFMLRGVTFRGRSVDKTQIVAIEFHGKRGVLNAGAYCIPNDVFNQLCKDWLETQGYMVIKGEVKE